MKRDYKTSPAKRASVKKYQQKPEAKAKKRIRERRYAKAKREADPDKCRADARNWVSKNKDKAAGYVKKWKQSNPLGILLARAKHRALQKGIEFTITADDLSFPEFCPVLGIKLNFGGKDSAPSIDRIINRFGYIPGNVVVVSWRANRLKSDGTIEEHEAIADYYRRLLNEDYSG